MSKTTPEEAIYLARKHGLILWSKSQSKELASLIDEVRGVDAEPVSHQFQDREGHWCPFADDEHYKNTVKDGSWPIRALYTRPAPSQPAAPVELPVVGYVNLRRLGYVASGESDGTCLYAVSESDHAEPLVKLSDAQAAIAAGRKAS